MGCMLISANEVIRSNDGVEIVTIHVVWTICYLSEWYVGYATILIWMICKICYCTNRAYRLSRGVVNSILVVQWAKRSFFYYHRFSFRGKSLKTSFSSQPTYIEREEIESQSHPKPSRLEKVDWNFRCHLSGKRHSTRRITKYDSTYCFIANVPQ